MMLDLFGIPSYVLFLFFIFLPEFFFIEKGMFLEF